MQAPTQAKKLTVLRMDRPTSRDHQNVLPMVLQCAFWLLKSSAKNNLILIKNFIDWTTGERRLQTWNVTAFLTPLG